MYNWFLIFVLFMFLKILLFLLLLFLLFVFSFFLLLIFVLFYFLFITFVDSWCLWDLRLPICGHICDKLLPNDIHCLGHFLTVAHLPVLYSIVGQKRIFYVFFCNCFSVWIKGYCCWFIIVVTFVDVDNISRKTEKRKRKHNKRNIVKIQLKLFYIYSWYGMVW